MNALAIFLVFIAGLIAGPIPANAFSPADFRQCSDVRGPIASGNLYRVHLGGNILAEARAGLEDLRVFSAGGKEIPWVAIADVLPHDVVETYPLEITGYDRSKASAVVFLKLPQKHRPIGALDLDVEDVDFKKRVVLSASNDGKTWRRVAEDSIYDFSSNVAVRRTAITFPKTDARYFRLQLADSGQAAAGEPALSLRYEGLDFSVRGKGKKELRIRAAFGSTGGREEKKTVFDQKTFDNPPLSSDKDGNTVMIVDAGLPLDRLSLDVSNTYFYRAVRLYGSDTGKEDSYQLLANGSIYRFPLSSEQREERSFMDVKAPKHRFYKIVVTNKNNPPLAVSRLGLAWVRQNLYFVALDDKGGYTLCFGNAQALRPEYDLVNFVNGTTLSRHVWQEAGLSTPRVYAQPHASLAGRLAGAEKTVLKVIVVLLVIGMVFWLSRLLKKPQEHDTK